MINFITGLRVQKFCYDGMEIGIANRKWNEKYSKAGSGNKISCYE